MKFKLIKKANKCSTIKFEDFLNYCLKDNEFKDEWESFDFSFNEGLDEYDKVLYEDDLTIDSLIKNNGVPKTVKTNISIEFFKVDNDCPVVKFLNNIENEKLKAKTVKSIYDLAIVGSSIRNTKLSKYVGDGIYELRTKQGSNIDRIFYFFVIGNKIIMTNGYIKKDQKMDTSEFERAKRYRDLYHGKK